MDAVSGNGYANLGTVLELVFFFGLAANWIVYSLWTIWFSNSGGLKETTGSQEQRLRKY